MMPTANYLKWWEPVIGKLHGNQLYRNKQSGKIGYWVVGSNGIGYMLDV